MHMLRTENFDEQALDRIEDTILPSITLTLDALLDAASHAPHRNDAARSAELRTIAAQLAATARQLEALTSAAQPRPEWPIRISA